MRLIDADKLYKKIFHEERLLEKCYVDHLGIITEQPTVDAVPVVRCRECKHREEKIFWCEKVQDFISNPEWFCADGERKGGDE